tara:strand:+ start:154 stop:393 length:240 start_codon:yes stop_codon:yes gene_type:complete
MNILGYILIIFALADFATSWIGINLTPFLPNNVAQFSPIIIGGIGYLLINAKTTQSGTDDPALDRFREKPKKKIKKKSK